MFLFIAKSQNQLPDHPRVGTLVTPSNGAIPGDRPWAADNEAFVGFDPGRFRAMLERIPVAGCRFVAVPDVVADHDGTMRRWRRWRSLVDRWPAAFCLQDGCTEIPDDADAVFIGGTTEWKLSETARRLVDSFGGWCHMGRVNTQRRLRVAKAWGCDSVDGTGLARFTDTYVGKHLAASEYQHLTLV